MVEGKAPLGLPANIVLARLLLSKNLPVEIRKVGENRYSTYDGRIEYDGNKNLLTLKKREVVLVGGAYEPQNVVEHWEVIVDGGLLNARLLT